VAQFIGTPPMNILDLAPGPGGAVIAGGTRPVTDAAPGHLRFGVRPEHLRLVERGEPARVQSSEYFGADTIVTCRIGEQSLQVRMSGRPGLADGALVQLAWDPAAAHFFDTSSGNRRDDDRQARAASEGGRRHAVEQTQSPGNGRGGPVLHRPRRHDGAGGGQDRLLLPRAGRRTGHQGHRRLRRQVHGGQSRHRGAAVYAGNYNDTTTKALTAAKAGTPPAVAVLLATDIFTLIDEDVVDPIDGFIKTDEDKAWLAGFMPAYLKSAQVKGKLWSVPFQRSTAVMYYNKKAFKEAGLDPEKYPTTWDEMVAAARP
jgi:hypothetical protein